MNDAFTQWLAAHATAPGLLACGIRASEISCLCHAASEKCPAEKMEKILHQLADAQPWLFNESLAPRWCTWTFEHGQIRLVNRPEGFLLGLVAAPDAAAQQLDQLAEEFLALPPAG
jgi:hypothetical protein